MATDPNDPTKLVLISPERLEKMVSVFRTKPDGHYSNPDIIHRQPLIVRMFCQHEWRDFSRPSLIGIFTCIGGNVYWSTCTKCGAKKG